MRPACLLESQGVVTATAYVVKLRPVTRTLFDYLDEPIAHPDL